jgi:hypothetical protein
MEASAVSRLHAFELQVPTLLGVVLWYVERDARRLDAEHD